MRSASRSERLALLTAAAPRAGILAPVDAESAEAWKAEWRSMVRAACECRALRVIGEGTAHPRLSRPPLQRELPPTGSWIRFKPHVSSEALVFMVLGFVPVGEPIDDVLTVAQLAILQDGIRQRCHHGDRVVLGEPNGSNLIASIRTSLAGAVAARAVVISDPDMIHSRRRAAPLPKGCHVAWEWHSSFGTTQRSGIVQGYIPAGQDVSIACPGAPTSCRIRPLSDQDRYLVLLDGRRNPTYRTPPAFLVEAPECATEAS